MGDIGLVNILIAVAIGWAIWRLATWTLRLLASPPPEVDPANVVELSQDYRCSICGTELTVRRMSLTETAPPKHCREEMDPIG